MGSSRCAGKSQREDLKVAMLIGPRCIEQDGRWRAEFEGGLRHGSDADADATTKNSRTITMACHWLIALQEAVQGTHEAILIKNNTKMDEQLKPCRYAPLAKSRVHCTKRNRRRCGCLQVVLLDLRLGGVLDRKFK